MVLKQVANVVIMGLDALGMLLGEFLEQVESFVSFSFVVFKSDFVNKLLPQQRDLVVNRVDLVC